MPPAPAASASGQMCGFPAAAGRHGTDAARRVFGQPPSMSSASYAVTWRNGDGLLHSGKAELRSHALRLEAVGGDVEDLRYEDLTGVSIARTASARIAGRQTLVLERRDASSLRLASISQLGIISELAERLAELHLGRVLARNRIVVVIPLRGGVLDEVRSLVDKGPPFDLDQAGIRQHQVFPTDHEQQHPADAPAAPGRRRRRRAGLRCFRSRHSIPTRTQPVRVAADLRRAAANARARPARG